MASTGRKCGGCTLCCTYLAVITDDGTFSKESWTACEHCLRTQCSIYADRPEPCRVYECLWLRTDRVPKRFRPDKTEAVLDLSEDGKALLVYCKERDRQKMTSGKSAFSRWLLNLAETRAVVLMTERTEEPIGRTASRVNLISE